MIKQLIQATASQLVVIESCMLFQYRPTGSEHQLQNADQIINEHSSIAIYSELAILRLKFSWPYSQLATWIIMTQTTKIVTKSSTCALLSYITVRMYVELQLPQLYIKLMALSMLSLVTLLDPAEKTINCNISSSHACRFISPSLLIGEHTMNHVHIAKPFVDCGGLSCLSDQKYNGRETHQSS